MKEGKEKTMSRKNKGNGDVVESTGATEATEAGTGTGTGTGKVRGAIPLDQQIAKLEALVGPEGVAQADAWVADAKLHEIVKLAFKKLPKALKPARDVLTKREEKVYAELVESVGADVAMAWKTNLLNRRAIGAA